MREILTKNLGLKILAFVGAALLWLVVINIDDPVKSKTFNNISVKVINETVVKSKGGTYRILDGTESVSVTVQAKQSVLQKIKKEDIEVTANMKELTLGTQIPLVVEIDGYDGNYTAYTTPLNMQVQIENEATKKFAIAASANGTVRDGYVVGETKVNPEKVTVSGPASVVEKIAKVEAAVNVNGLSGNKTLPSELVYYDENNNVVNDVLLTNNLGESGVSVDVEIHKIKSVSLEFDTSDLKTESGYYLGEVSSEPQEIQISGTDEVLSETTVINIPAEALALNGLKERTEKVVDITPYLPEGAKLVDEDAGTVVVTIDVEEGGVKTVSIPVGNISVINSPSGMEWSYESTDEIDLRIQGTEEMLEELKLGAQDVNINLVDIREAGKYKVKVIVNLKKGYVLVEDVYVTVVLTEK